MVVRTLQAAGKASSTTGGRHREHSVRVSAESRSALFQRECEGGTGAPPVSRVCSLRVGEAVGRVLVAVFGLRDHLVLCTETKHGGYKRQHSS